MGQYPPYPMQPPGYPQSPQSVQRLSPYQTIGKGDQNNRPHPNTKASPRSQSRGYQPQQVFPSSSLPPSGMQRPNLNSIKSTSSFDSATSQEKDARQQQPQRRSKDVPPPPPPPPLPTGFAHVRSDSTGSVSSLGSMVHTEGEDDRQEKKRQPDPRMGETEGSEGFFQRLNPWSPKKPTVKDFHQKNQAFLRRHDRQNSNTPPMSPRSQQLRYAVSLPYFFVGLPATIYFCRPHLFFVPLVILQTKRNGSAACKSRYTQTPSFHRTRQLG
jgi:hypothetical protein